MTQELWPRGSRYLLIRELGPKDFDYYGFWGLSPQCFLSGPSG